MMNFKEKKYILIFILSVFISVTTLIGGSYALIQRVLVGNNTYSMKTGDFVVEFSESQEVTLSNQVPVYDNVGMNTGDEFTFSVTNNGNYVSSYSIKIEDLSTEGLGEVIRYAVNYGDGYKLENVHSLKNNQYIIQNKSLEVGGTDNYKLRFWLDIDATEVYINKVFSAKVVVEATQEEYKYGTNIIESVYDQEDKEGLVAIKNDGTLASENDEVREYRYSGANPNNYVWFNCDDGYTSGSNHCEKWRIIGSFDNTYENGVGTYRMLKIVRDDALSNTLPFNSNEGNKANYEGSSLETYLNETYFNSLNENTKDLVVKAKWNNGELFNSVVTAVSYNKELNRNIYDYVGLINASDFGYASTNTLWDTALNIEDTFTNSNNYLYQENSVVLNTPNTLGTGVYYVASTGLTKGNTTTSYNVRPTVYLKPDVSIINGFGTSDEPYELSIKYPMEYGMKTELKITGELYEIAKIELANNLLDSDGDARIVSGDNSIKNYVWYSGKLWRIVALNEDGSIKLVTDENISTISWGANTTYEGSWIYQWLNEDFKDTLYNYENLLVTNYRWNATETTATAKPDETTMVEETVGMLNAYEYIQSYNKASAVTGYLNNRYYWWTITPHNSANISYVNIYGNVANSTSFEMYGIRPSINLKSNIRLARGLGSKEKPYIIEGDISIPMSGELISNRVSGEYVDFNNELYRIVGKENDITKITKVDYIRNDVNNVVTKSLSSSITYGSGTTKTYWDYYLNNDWYNTIIGNYRNMLVKSDWYLGMVGNETNNNYKNSVCATVNTTQKLSLCDKTNQKYNGYIGLGRIGEMFTSQIDEGDSSSSTIWSITPATSLNSRVVYIYGNASAFELESMNSVRPSMFLSKDVYITSGDGTRNNPFEIAM